MYSKAEAALATPFPVGSGGEHASYSRRAAHVDSRSSSTHWAAPGNGGRSRPYSSAIALCDREGTRGRHRSASLALRGGAGRKTGSLGSAARVRWDESPAQEVAAMEVLGAQLGRGEGDEEVRADAGPMRVA